MTQQHTPGPWTLRRLKPDPHGIIMIGGWEIWTRLYDVVGGTLGVAPIRNEADARLIAAAPDLLAALQVLVLTPHILYYLETRDPMALKQAQAAIAKATSPSR